MKFVIAIFTLLVANDALAIEPQAVFYPVANAQVTSDFGVRIHPVLKVVRHHNGVDLKGRRGTIVRTVFGGEVVFTGDAGSLGLAVVIRHKNNLTTHYGHLSRVLVQAGDLIPSGEPIGRVGDSGLTTGPHLHFEVRRDGVPLPPQSLLPDLNSEAEG